jgi:hypothetical protein
VSTKQKINLLKQKKFFKRKEAKNMTNLSKKIISSLSSLAFLFCNSLAYAGQVDIIMVYEKGTPVPQEWEMVNMLVPRLPDYSYGPEATVPGIPITERIESLLEPYKNYPITQLLTEFPGNPTASRAFQIKTYSHMIHSTLNHQLVANLTKHPLLSFTETFETNMPSPAIHYSITLPRNVTQVPCTTNWDKSHFHILSPKTFQSLYNSLTSDPVNIQAINWQRSTVTINKTTFTPHDGKNIAGEDYLLSYVESPTITGFADGRIYNTIWYWLPNFYTPTAEGFGTDDKRPPENTERVNVNH